MRKIRKRKGNRSKKMIIITTFALILCLTAGYAAFGTTLNLKAKGNVVVLEDLYVASYGSDTTGNGTMSKPFNTIQMAYNRAGDAASIHILDNITQKETINFDKDKEITLDSVNNKSVIRDTSLTNTLLNITSGTITFKNITFDGNNVEASDTLINVEGSNIMIENGTIIKNAYNTYDSGGGIYLINANLTMNGGEFFNNTSLKGGAAIFIYGCRNTSFIMNGGEIHDNNSQDGAIWSNGIITINNGKIYNNTSIKDVGSGGAGAIYNNGSLTIKNGEIYGNSAQYGGAIAIGKYLGCSPYYQELYLSGGKIYNNSSVGAHGGGIYLHSSTIYSNTGGTIENNTPDNVYRAS